MNGEEHRKVERLQRWMTCEDSGLGNGWRVSARHAVTLPLYTGGFFVLPVLLASQRLPLYAIGGRHPCFQPRNLALCLLSEPMEWFLCALPKEDVSQVQDWLLPPLLPLSGVGSWPGTGWLPAFRAPSLCSDRLLAGSGVSG